MPSSILARRARAAARVAPALLLAACTMSHAAPRFGNPPSLSAPTGYSHVAAVPPGHTMLYIAGQVALDSTGALVGPGDFAAQTRQVFENLQRALAANGATFADVVKMTTFVTDASKTPVLREIRARYLNVQAPPPNTLVEVRRLARDEWLIEIEAIAAVPTHRR